jgi:multiple sugar transport system ATP-binding protein
MNLLPGRYAGDGSPVLQCEGFALPIGQRAAAALPPAPAKIVVGLRPEALEVRLTAAAGTIPGTVETVHFQGDQNLCVVHVGSERVQVVMDGRAQLSADTPIWLEPRSEQMHLFDAETGNRFPLEAAAPVERTPASH